MDTATMGALEVSVVGLGCNNFGMKIDADETRAVVDAAIDAGITYFDTAETYGGGKSEEFLGAALSARRSQVLIATKWGARASEGAPRPGSAEAVRTALEGSLRRLGTDYVDHYQLHVPDATTPVAETLAALAELQAEGKVREIGCSNFSAAMLDDAAAASAAGGVHPFASVQNHYSLLTRTPETDGVLDACGRLGVAFVPYFPLEAGVLTGKYKAGEAPAAGTRLAAWGERAGHFLDDDRAALVAQLAAWSEARGHSVLDLAMSWLVTNPRVATVIAGATSPAQVEANAGAVGWSLSADERAEVDALLAGG